MNDIEDWYTEPSGEPFHITSELRWDEVTLPESLSVADLDAAIMSELTSRRRKTAMVIGNARVALQRTRPEIDPAIIGARIQALAEAGRIEGAGDLRAWRHSEVKLKD